MVWNYLYNTRKSPEVAFPVVRQVVTPARCIGRGNLASVQSRWRKGLLAGSCAQCPQCGVGGLVCQEKTLGAELVERNIIRCAESCRGGEEPEGSLPLLHFNRQERRGRSSQIERSPVAGASAISALAMEQRLPEGAGLTPRPRLLQTALTKNGPYNKGVKVDCKAVLRGYRIYYCWEWSF